MARFSAHLPTPATRISLLETLQPGRLGGRADASHAPAKPNP